MKKKWAIEKEMLTFRPFVYVSFGSAYVGCWSSGGVPNVSGQQLSCCGPHAIERVAVYDSTEPK